jgi:pimeloyl-ACP methyl ester carboxylesterase
MPRVRSQGTSIDYLDEGLGDPALLLLPDWCATRSGFAPVRGRLSDHRRVLSLDWRGHGASGPAPADFGVEDLARDALAVVADSGAQAVVPVALAQAGWVAVELRRRLGHAVPGLVLVDWIVSAAPPALLLTLEDLRSAPDREEAIAGMLQLWQAGVTDPALAAYLAEMGAASDEEWERAAREIESSYARHGSPLRALAGPDHPPPVLHLVPARSADAVTERELAYSAEHAWYRAASLEAHSHFPFFEAPRQAADEIEGFVRRVGGRRRVPRAA